MQSLSKLLSRFRFIYVSFCLVLTITNSISFIKAEDSSANEKCQNGICYNYVTAHETEVLLPRLSKHHNEKIIPIINKALDEFHKNLKCSWIEPDDIPEKDSDEYFEYLHRKELGSSKYDVRSKVTFTEADVFSIEIKGSWYCGGAYPIIDSSMHLTFDLRTGKDVQFEDLFSDYDQNKKAIIERIFAGLILPKGEEEQEAHCGKMYHLTSLLDYGHGFSYYFSAEGLIVTPDFPKASSACIIPARVSYVALKPFAKESGILNRVIKLKEENAVKK